MSNQSYKSSVELVRMLAGTIARAMPVLSAKQMFCGETLPISDFHRAMQMAERNGWIAYSRDHLSIRLA